MENISNYSGSENVLELRNINQSYTDKDGKEFVLFDNFNMAVEDLKGKGQFIVIMGESGCGKSTLLRYLTGLQTPNSGEILLAGKPLKLTDTIPMVFQMPSSLEWYSVLKNVALPLILKGVGKEEAEAKAMEMIKIVDLVGHEHKYAKYPLLSGGQLQRVAIARSLVANPNMIMMDEPFSALDSNNRKKMQNFLASIFLNSETNNLNPTVILVSHDAREAAFLANDIFIMGTKPGHIKNHIKVDFQTRDASMRKSADYIKLVSFIEDAIDNNA
jgi:NitT/TauT family transport system ATP-binding protein